MPGCKEVAGSLKWVLGAQSAISSGWLSSMAQKVCVGYWTATPDSVNCHRHVTGGLLHKTNSVTRRETYFTAGFTLQRTEHCVAGAPEIDFASLAACITMIQELTPGPQNNTCTGPWAQLTDCCADSRASRASVLFGCQHPNYTYADSKAWVLLVGGGTPLGQTHTDNTSNACVTKNKMCSQSSESGQILDSLEETVFVLSALWLNPDQQFCSISYLLSSCSVIQEKEAHRQPSCWKSAHSGCRRMQLFLQCERKVWLNKVQRSEIHSPLNAVHMRENSTLDDEVIPDNLNLKPSARLLSTQM